MEVSYSQPADLNLVRNQVAALGLNDVQVQNFGSAQDVLIRMPPVKKGSTTDQQSDTGHGRAQGWRSVCYLAPQ